MTSHDAKVAAVLRAAGENKYAGIAHAFMSLYPEEYKALQMTANEALVADVIPCTMHPVWHDAVNARHAAELDLIEQTHYIPTYEKACLVAAEQVEAR